MVGRLRLLALLALATLAAAVLVFSGSSAASPSRTRLLGTEVLAHVTPGGGTTGDVFGHGRYAYLGSFHGSTCPALGVRVYDLANPRRPVRVSTFADVAGEPDVAGSWTEKTIVRHVSTAAFTGELAVTSFQRCATGGFQGFGLYDVTNPAQPRRLALVPTAPRGSHEIWLAAARRHAWVYTAIPYSELESSPDFDRQTRRATIPGEPDFRIFDVSNPGEPVQVGSWGAWKSLNVRPWDGRGRFFPVNFVHSVTTNAAATRAFLSYWDLGTVILDISSPARPRYLGRTTVSDAEGDAHSTWLAKGGKVLIETHENGFGRPYFFDIRNPRKPRLLSRFGPVATNANPSAFQNGVHDAKVIGNRAYFSWYSRGVYVVDIRNTRKPKAVAHFVPKPSESPDRSFCDGGACSLIWGVYPTSKYVLASDIVGGLWVFRVKR